MAEVSRNGYIGRAEWDTQTADYAVAVFEEPSLLAILGGVPPKLILRVHGTGPTRTMMRFLAMETAHPGSLVRALGIEASLAAGWFPSEKKLWDAVRRTATADADRQLRMEKQRSGEEEAREGWGEPEPRGKKPRKPWKRNPW